MVFLGVWALFGIGTFAGGRLPRSDALAERTGMVLARADVPQALPVAVAPTAVLNTRIADPILSAQLAGGPTAVEFTRSIEDALLQQPEPAPSTEFIIGRISAWICTVLYLTSRLPQIWKNVSVLC